MLSRRFLYALALGLAVPAAASAQVALPTGGTIKEVDFERHVMGLLSKVGCNAGSCHGSFQGKNGFRLSLFGYEPAMDFANLTRDNLGRRVNVVEAGREPAAPEGHRPDGARRRHALRQGRLGLQHLPRVDPCRREVDAGQRQDREARGQPVGLRAARQRQAAASEGDRHVRRRLEGRHHAVLRLQDHRRRDRRALAARVAHAATTGRRGPDGALSRQRAGDPRAGAVAGRSRAATRACPK